MLQDGVSTTPHLGDEGRTKPTLLKFVVLRRVVQFPLSQRVERDAHRSDPGSSVAKHLVCGTI